MGKKDELRPGTKNAFFNTDEETALKNHFQRGEINQFHCIILDKAYENYPEIKIETWDDSMDLLEKTSNKTSVKEQMSKLPETDREILIANLLYLILTTPWISTSPTSN